MKEKEVDPIFEEQVSNFRPKKKKRRIWRDEDIGENPIESDKKPTEKPNLEPGTFSKKLAKLALSDAKKKTDLKDFKLQEGLDKSVSPEVLASVISKKLSLIEVKCLIFIILNLNEGVAKLSYYSFNKFITTSSNTKIKSSIKSLEEKGVVFTKKNEKGELVFSLS